MSDGQTMTPHAPLDEEAIRTFRSDLSGHLILPEDGEYDEARALFNAMIDKRPALIARCRTTADVARAVKFAREQGRALSVRGGGHSVAGTALVDDGLVIDLAEMNDVTVNPEKQTALVQGGAIWKDVDQATHEHGMATPGGTFSPTGVGGLTLGGGIAWLMRKYGLTCDNLVRAEVVTADGEVIHASETEHPDLYWGIRGGCGNFGAVTEFEFRLHPVHTILGGMILHPVDQAKEALQFYREFNRTAPDELTTFAGVMATPDGHEVVAFVFCYNGDLDQGQEVLKPLADWGTPILKETGPMPYPLFQQMLDETMPPGLQNYWTSAFLTGLDDEVIDTVIRHFRESTSPLNLILFEQLGGAMGRVTHDATAFPHRNASYNSLVIARWIDPADADAQVSWARQVREDLLPHSTGGSYINYMANESQQRIKAAYGPETYARLAEIKAKYDPDNLFRSTQNIPPAQ